MLSQKLLDHLDRLAAAETDEEVWACVEAYCHAIGFPDVNYGYFDTRNHALQEAPLRLVSTMDPGWLAFYGEEGLDRFDPLVRRIQEGERRPVVFRDELLHGEDGHLSKEKRDFLGVAEESGVRNAVSIPLLSPFQASGLVSGLTFITPASDEEFRKIWEEHAQEMVLFAQAVHQRMSATLFALLEGVVPPSPRERDCLALVAQGHRTARIAHRLGLAEVTVRLHLTQARRKLKAKTLPEAVLKAVRFGFLAP